MDEKNELNNPWLYNLNDRNRDGFANQASLQHGQNHINSSVACEGDKTRINTNGKADQLFAGMENLERNFSFNRVCDKIDAVNRNIVETERRLSDRQRDTDAQIAANAKEAALCCCNLSKEVAAQGQKTVERELSAANAEVMYLRSREHHGRG